MNHESTNLSRVPYHFIIYDHRTRITRDQTLNQCSHHQTLVIPLVRVLCVDTFLVPSRKIFKTQWFGTYNCGFLKVDTHYTLLKVYINILFPIFFCFVYHIRKVLVHDALFFPIDDDYVMGVRFVNLN